MTSSIDNYIRLWDLNGNLMGSLNINHPLPIKWSNMEDFTSIHRRKVLYSLKILENVIGRYKHKMLFSEESKISVNRFLKNLANRVQLGTLAFLDNEQQQ